MPKVYLGISQWMKGHPNETTRIWTKFGEYSSPELAHEFASRAAALRILAAHLSARTILAEPAPNRGLPLTVDSVFISPMQADNLPSLALHALLLHSLRNSTVQPASRIRIQALLAEQSIDLAQSSHAANMVAGRLLGAEYATRINIEAPSDSNLITTTVELFPLERTAQRIKRLKQQHAETRHFTSMLAMRAEQLEPRIKRCDAALQYFEAKEALDRKLKARSQLLEKIELLQKSGKVRQAARVMLKHQRLSKDIAARLRVLKHMERSPLVLAAGTRGFTPDSVTDKRTDLTQALGKIRAEHDRIKAYEQRFAYLLRKARSDAPFRTRFTIPRNQMPIWPEAAANAFAKLAGLPSIPLSHQAAFRTATELQMLERALRAYDDGEYARAARLARQAGALADRVPPSPGKGFDPLVLAAKQPAEIARHFVDAFRVMPGCTPGF